MGEQAASGMKSHGGASNGELSSRGGECGKGTSSSTPGTAGKPSGFTTGETGHVQGGSKLSK